MKKSLIVLFSAAMLFTSCKDAEVKAYITEVKSMQEQLADIKQKYESTPSDSNGIMVAIVRNDLLNVKKHYIGADTTNIYLGNVLNSYKSIRKVFSSTAKSSRIITNAIPEEEKQLNDLLHDLETGNNDRTKYEAFVNTEKRNIAQLDTLTRIYHEKTIEQSNKFHTLKPVVDSLINTFNL